MQFSSAYARRRESLAGKRFFTHVTNRFHSSPADNTRLPTAIPVPDIAPLACHTMLGRYWRGSRRSIMSRAQSYGSDVRRSTGGMAKDVETWLANSLATILAGAGIAG